MPGRKDMNKTPEIVFVAECARSDWRDFVPREGQLRELLDFTPMY